MSTPRRGWCLCCVDLGITERYGRVVESHRIVALKTATSLASLFVELVLRESPVGEHATSGVAESAMREVKRQTRSWKRMWERSLSTIPS